MAANSTVGDLLHQGAILARDVHVAADAYLADPGISLFLLGVGYVLDLAAAVEADTFACKVLRNPAVTRPAKQAAVRAAILLARPRKL